MQIARCGKTKLDEFFIQNKSNGLKLQSFFKAESHSTSSAAQRYGSMAVYSYELQKHFAQSRSAGAHDILSVANVLISFQRWKKKLLLWHRKDA